VTEAKLFGVKGYVAVKPISIPRRTANPAQSSTGEAGLARPRFESAAGRAGFSQARAAAGLMTGYDFSAGLLRSVVRPFDRVVHGAS